MKRAKEIQYWQHQSAYVWKANPICMGGQIKFTNHDEFFVSSQDKLFNSKRLSEIIGTFSHHAV